MNFRSQMIVVGFVIALTRVLMTSSLIAHWMTAEAQNSTSSIKPTTKMVVNMTDQMIKIVNMTNNQTIGVKPYD